MNNHFFAMHLVLIFLKEGGEGFFSFFSSLTYDRNLHGPGFGSNTVSSLDGKLERIFPTGQRIKAIFVTNSDDKKK